MRCQTCGIRQRDAFSSARASRCRRCERDSKLRSKYGLSLEEYEAMLERQDGRCAICVQRKPSHVDHDHDTGRVRGLLCNQCNRGIGLLGDSAERVARALHYLV